MNNYAKLAWALIGGVALFLKSALGDGMTDQEWLHVATIAVGIFGVWLIPNTSALAAAKTWVMALAAVLVVAETLLTGGITPAEWSDLLIVLLTAAGVLPTAGGAPMYTARPVGALASPQRPYDNPHQT